MNKTDQLDKEFDIFNISALRVCALPFYDCGETGEVKKYMAGHPVAENTNSEWLEKVKKWTSEGKKIVRIIVLPTEANDYNKWLLRVIELNTLAGEEVVFISEENYLKLLNNAGASDYWIFDDKKVVKMFYDEKNDYTHCEIIKSEIEDYINLFVVLYENSTPLTEVLRKTRAKLEIVI